MEEKKNLPQQYISTPFAYTKFSKNLSLLQQRVLLKVSEHLQSYVRHFFGSSLRKDPKVPRPLFSEAEKNNGMPEFVMSYAELGVEMANYNVARAAVQEVLNLTVDAPSVDGDGKASIKAFNIFSHANISFEGGSCVSFRLNPEVVDNVFDMSQGYVRHPADIARIGQIERMPMMYYYLYKRSEHWKNRVVCLTVLEIKRYLGMLGKISEGTDERSGRPLKDGREKKEAYPKFSQFKKNVLESSINDINRLRKEGLLDVCVSYEPVYNGKRKVGNPEYIKFTIYNTIEQMEQAAAKTQGGLFDAIDNGTSQSVKKDVATYTQENVAYWNDFVSGYSGSLAPLISKGEVLGTNECGFLELSFDSPTFNILLKSDEWSSIREEFKKHAGIKYGPGIQIKVK